jgi:TfoX/Sxy family transcriptional regulator of competence genes
MPKATQSKAMPKFTRAPEELVRAFENAIKDFPMAEQRKLFGYPAAFVNGQMFTGLHQDNMILRLSEADRAKFMAEYRTKLFEPMPGRPMKEYVLVPKTMLKSSTQLNAWIGRALAYAKGLPPKVKAKKIR